MIAAFHAGNARADFHDDARPLMAEDRREQPFRIGAGERVFIRVADAGGFHFHHHLARFGAVDFYHAEVEGFTRLPSDGRACFHG